LIFALSLCPLPLPFDLLVPQAYPRPASKEVTR
jgi:hypothetical protein